MRGLISFQAFFGSFLLHLPIFDSNNETYFSEFQLTSFLNVANGIQNYV